MQTLGEKRRVVSFNLDRERDLFDLSGDINFSAFVKRHLLSELERRKQQDAAARITVNLGEEESASTC